MCVLGAASLALATAGCEQKGSQGPAGAAFAPEGGLQATVEVSAPPRGRAYFEPGDRITFSVTTTDTAGNALAINSTNLSSDRFYIYGPLEQSKTVTAQGLMNVSAANAYIHLEGPHTGLSVRGNVATYVSGPVTAEEAGTYRAVARLRATSDDYDRAFVMAEFQIKTAAVETETVALSSCASCHQGADNGHIYLHHSDSSSGPGSYEYDDQAIGSCKTCHNQDGYANTTDSWVAARTRTPDPIISRVHGIHMGAGLKSPRNTHRMAITNPLPDVPNGFDPTTLGDPTSSPVGLLKGVLSGAEARVISSDGSSYFALGHVTGAFVIGEGLEIMTVPDPTKTSYDKNKQVNEIGSATVAASTAYGRSGNTSVAVLEGYFADYTTVVFPSDVMNCTACHVDDAWKAKPTQSACAACHDNIWWGSPAATPEGFKKHPGGEVPDITNGVPGVEHDVSQCVGCHPSGTQLTSTGARHTPTRFAGGALQAHTVELELDPPPPADGYVFGDTPTVWVTVRDAETGLPVDPTTITQANWKGLTLLVSGPRDGASTPVLTTAAKGKRTSVSNGTSGPWDLSGDPTFTLAVDGAAAMTVTATAAEFSTPGAATATEVVAWLNGEASFSAVAVAYPSGSANVTLKNMGLGSPASRLEILPSAVATQMGWAVGVVNPGGYTTGNDLRVRADPYDVDPKVTHNAAESRIEYVLDDVVAVSQGTYSIYVNGYQASRPEGYALLNFQVGTGTPDEYIATNCVDCHGETLFHLDAGGRHPVEFNTDYCKNCHDYEPEQQSDDVWAAFGADPVVKKIHGLHRGKYLQYPDKIYPNNPIWSGIVFPQDIRNCTKCHSADTTGTWNTEPSRLACGSCHDSDAAEAHMTVQTLDATPVYDAIAKTGGAWSGDESESCKVCHGEGREFEAKKVHSVSDPYVPPGAR